MKAIVRSLVKKAKNGPYAIAKAKSVEGSITFALNSSVWAEKLLPEPGAAVCLNELEQRRAGWRAKSARFWQPSDEQDHESKQPTKSAKRQNHGS